MQPHLVHVFPTFAVGGAQTVMAQIINGLGTGFRHSIVALDGRFQACEKITSDASVVCVDASETRGLKAAWQHLNALNPDLVTSCNWGSFDWALAAALRPGLRHLHQEHGFGLEEASRRHRRRNLARRVMLRGSDGLIVPSKTLQTLALREWRCPPDKLHYVPNGVDGETLRAGTATNKPEPGNITIGTVAPLRPEKQIGHLIRAFAKLQKLAPNLWPELRLRVVGDGSERGPLEKLVLQSQLHGQVEFFGHRDDPVHCIAGFDIYAISSATEQLPVSILHAMALGKPVAGYDVGDVAMMVSSDNAATIIASQDPDELAQRLHRLVDDATLRADLGAKNAEIQMARYGEQDMIERYRALFTAGLREAIG